MSSLSTAAGSPPVSPSHSDALRSSDSDDATVRIDAHLELDAVSIDAPHEPAPHGVSATDEAKGEEADAAAAASGSLPPITTRTVSGNMLPGGIPSASPLQTPVLDPTLMAAADARLAPAIDLRAIAKAMMKVYPEGFVEPILRKPTDEHELFSTDMSKWLPWSVELRAIMDGRFWVANAIDFTSDKRTFAMPYNRHKEMKQRGLSPAQKRLFQRITAFFAESDARVNKNLQNNFAEEVTDQSMRMFFNAQVHNEDYHTATYAGQLEACTTDAEELRRVRRDVSTCDSIRRKQAWMQHYTDTAGLNEAEKRATFGARVAAFVAVEGIFFSGSFAVISYFQHKGIPLFGSYQANKYIREDEGTHCSHNCCTVLHLDYKPQQEWVHRIFEDAVAVESAFWKDALPKDILGLSAETMITYTKFVANYWLLKMKMDPLYTAEDGSPLQNPCDWVVALSLESKANFFEQRVTEYALTQNDMGHEIPSDVFDAWCSDAEEEEAYVKETTRNAREGSGAGGNAGAGARADALARALRKVDKIAQRRRADDASICASIGNTIPIKRTPAETETPPAAPKLIESVEIVDDTRTAPTVRPLP